MNPSEAELSYASKKLKWYISNPPITKIDELDMKLLDKRHHILGLKIELDEYRLTMTEEQIAIRLATIAGLEEEKQSISRELTELINKDERDETIARLEKRTRDIA